MSKYVVMESRGLLEKEAFTLMGASTKRNDDKTIGQFGTGLKYAIAGILREGLDVKIWSGNKTENHIHFRTKEIKFKDKVFNQVQYKPISKTRWKDTGFTSEMGLNWTLEDSLREIVANALDEGGFEYDIITDVTEYLNSKDSTRIVIEMNNGVQDYFNNFNNHFSVFRKPLWEEKGLKIFRRGEGKGILYLKGVKVFETDKKTIFDYEVTRCDISEQRRATKEEASYRITKLLDYLPTNFKKEILNKINSEYLEADSPTYVSKYPSEWGEVVPADTVIVTSTEMHNNPKLAAKLSIPYTVLPDNFARSFLNGNYTSLKTALGKINYIDLNPYSMSEKEELLLKSAKDFLERAGYDLTNVEIEVYENKDSMTIAQVRNRNTIRLFEASFRKGKKELIHTLLHELFHIRSGQDDETREFEEYIIGEVVEQIELKLGEVL